MAVRDGTWRGQNHSIFVAFPIHPSRVVPVEPKTQEARERSRECLLKEYNKLLQKKKNEGKMRIVTSSLGNVGGGASSSPSSHAGGKKDHDMVATGKYQARVPRGLRVLHQSTSGSSSPSAELSDLKTEAAMIEQWWQEPRWNLTNRIYSRKSRREAKEERDGRKKEGRGE